MAPGRRLFCCAPGRHPFHFLPAQDSTGTRQHCPGQGTDPALCEGKGPRGTRGSLPCLKDLSGAVRFAQHARHRTVWHSIAQSGGIKRAGSGEGQFFVRFGGHCACVLGGSDRSFLRAPGPPDTRCTLFPAGTRARAALSSMLSGPAFVPAEPADPGSSGSLA